MEKTPNSKLLEVVVMFVIQIVSKLTSHGYAIVVTDTMLKKLSKENPCLKFVSIHMDSPANEVVIDPSVDGFSDVDIGMAINALIDRVDKLTGNYKFKKEIWFYLNPHECRLKELSVDLMS